MKSMDERISEALRAEGGDAPEDEQILRDVVWGVFRSRRRWLVIFAVAYSLVFVAIAIVSGLQFFGASSTRDQILWAAVFLASLQIIGLTKIFYWMQTERVSIAREVKRLELQIARLRRQLGE